MYMFNEINHQFVNCKNKVVSWLGNDSFLLFQDNLKTSMDQLIKYDWIDKKVIYKFNSHGFRCDEFSHDDSVMFLGCSNTLGMALPLEDTWAYQVAKNLNLKSVNLGIPGTGPDTAFRLANHYIPQIKPKIVVYLETPPGRFCLVSSKKHIYDFSVTESEFLTDNMFKEYYEHWLSNEENIILNSLKHKLAIQSLCHDHGIKFIYVENKEFHPIDFARDLMHYGIHSNLNLSKLVLDRININV